MQHGRSKVQNLLSPKKVCLNWKPSKHLQNHCNPDKTKLKDFNAGKAVCKWEKSFNGPRFLSGKKKNVAKAMKGVGK